MAWLALSFDPEAERRQWSGEVTLEVEIAPAAPVPAPALPEAEAGPRQAAPSETPAAEPTRRQEAAVAPAPQASEAPSAAGPKGPPVPVELPVFEPPPLPPEAQAPPPNPPPNAPPPAKEDTMSVAPEPHSPPSPRPSAPPTAKAAVAQKPLPQEPSPQEPLPQEPPAAPPPAPPPPAAPSAEPASPRASRPVAEERRVALAPVPDPALVDHTAKGPLPVIAPDGRKAWQVYGRPFDEADKRPRIAIIIAGAGQSRSADDAAIQGLPGAVTLAFTPYAHDLAVWIEEARAAGHEVMLLLPMEPVDYPQRDPGPQALLTSLSTAENFDRLEWLLSRVTGYVGVANYLGSRFTTSPEHLRPVLRMLQQRGLMFLDSRASPDSQGGRIASEIALPHALNNRFIDAEASRAAIDRRLAELERIARASGTAVGMGVPYPVTIERVAHWAAKLADRGIALAPVSAVVNRQEIE